jgi:hypothetical protein
MKALSLVRRRFLIENNELYPACLLSAALWSWLAKIEAMLNLTEWR